MWNPNTHWVKTWFNLLCVSHSFFGAFNNNGWPFVFSFDANLSKQKYNNSPTYPIVDIFSDSLACGDTRLAWLVLLSTFRNIFRKTFINAFRNTFRNTFRTHIIFFFF